MLCNRALLLLAVVAYLPFAISQTCVWKDGTKATNYVPCQSGATSGTCCHAGEACLASGLCYGAPGLMYRGACVDSWDTPDCLTYCKECKQARPPYSLKLTDAPDSRGLLGQHLPMQRWPWSRQSNTVLVRKLYAENV